MDYIFGFLMGSVLGIMFLSLLIPDTEIEEDDWGDFDD